jgi:hypothetical protein
MIKRVRFTALLVVSVSSLLVLFGSVPNARKYARYLKNPTVLSECPESATQTSDAAGSAITAPQELTQTIHPAKVLVRPWDGRHQVYGVFVLPAGYHANEFFQVSLKDTGSYCGGVSLITTSDYGVSVQPGERIALGLLRTRTSMWLIAQGKRDQLKQPGNWVLQIEKPL